MIEPRHVHEAFDRFETFLRLHRQRDAQGRSEAAEAFWCAVGIDDDADRAGVFTALHDRLDLLPLTTSGIEGTKWGALFALFAARIAADERESTTLTDDDLAALLAGEGG